MNSSVLVSTSVKSDEDRHRGNRSKSLVRQGSVPLDSYYIPISPRTNHSESLVRR